MNEISIIGGGISGLYCATLLCEDGYSIHIYEKLKSFGGRIRSQHDKNNELLYECGPWRISTHHHLILALVSKLGLTLVKVKQPIVKKGFEKKKEKANNTLRLPNTNQLTEYQYRCIEQEAIKNVNQEMLEVGYDLLFERANTTRSYSLKKTHEEEDEFYVVQEGFDTIIKKLLEYLEKKPNVFLHDESCIENVDYNRNVFTLHIQKRMDKKTFQLEKKKTKILITAVPPHEMKRWKALTIEPNLQMVESYPLMHVYGLVKDFGQKQVKYVCNSPLSQVIQSCYENNWIQLSYSGGRFAKQMQNLQMMGNHLFEKYIQKEFSKFFPKVSIQKIVPYFWRHAVHFWKPNLKAKENKLKEKCIHPHKNKYPHLYWIGESISSKQGWMEGALETAKDVYFLLQKQKRKEKQFFPKEYVIYDERIIDVEKWKNVHPGGKDVILNHLGEDITELWRTFHSDEASRYFPLLEI